MKLPSHVREILEQKAFIYLFNKLSNQKGEVNMLEKIHENISELGDEWEKVLLNESIVGKFSMKSNFIHQTPKVSYLGIKKNSIEFGDILYVYTEEDSFGIKRENALLMQAKVFDNKYVDVHQLKLYTDWPEFWLVNSQVSNQKFNIKPSNQPHLGARYLLLDNSKANFEFASTATPKLNLKANDFDNYLERELVGLIEFVNGKELKDDWGDAIHLVQNKIHSKIYKNSLRSQNVMYMYSQLNQFDNNEFDSDFWDEGKGFWIVRIEAKLFNNENENLEKPLFE